MDNKTYTHTIKTLRQRRGLSQEELAEKSGLSLRTIQRIENGETEARGDSLKKIAAALAVAPNDIIDWTMQENRQFLSYLNLSALAFMVMSFLGIILPFVLWNAQKDTVKGVDRLGKQIINFQITWHIMLFALLLLLLVTVSIAMPASGDVSPTYLAGKFELFVFAFLLLFLYNIVIILVNQIRISKGADVQYLPRINFLR